MRPLIANAALLVISSCIAAGQTPSTLKPSFSEDFESAQLNSEVWEVKTAGAATVKLSSDQPARGKQSLQVNYPQNATQSYAMLVTHKLPEALRKHHFGRAYVKIMSALPAQHTVLVLSGETGWPLSKFNEIGVQKGTFQPSYQENKSARGQGRGEVVTHGDQPLPLGKWFLMEWEFNDNPNSVTIWVDGQVQTVLVNGEKQESSKFKWPKDSETASGLVGNGYEEFAIGVRVWGQVPEAFDVYYDDVALDSKRVGPAK